MFRFLTRILQPKPSRSRRSAAVNLRRRPLQVECLEDRYLMAAGPHHAALHRMVHPEPKRFLPIAVHMAADGPSISASGTTSAAASQQLPAPLNPPPVPAFSSLPGANATLYLDFNGHIQLTWGDYSPGVTPAFDLDGNTSSFNATELATIESIWKRVTEDYAPFNINVTTVNPVDFSNGKALRVVFGGTGSWYAPDYLGLSYIHSFTSSHPNVVYVFAKNFGGNNPAGMAKTASHEAGHAFGLDHHTANVLGRFPLMNQGLVTEATGRTTWYNQTQNDVAVLAGPTNGFGYRPDDHPSTTPLTTSAFTYSVSGKGIIEKTSDADLFSFSTIGGNVTLTVNVAAVGPNLDTKVELWKASPLSMITSAAPSNALGATISTNLAAGSYFLVVKSHGSYGDLGQYTITGSVPKNVISLSPPSLDIDPPVAVQPFVHPLDIVSTSSAATAVTADAVLPQASAAMTSLPASPTPATGRAGLSSLVGATVQAAATTRRGSLGANPNPEDPFEPSGPGAPVIFPGTQVR